MNFKFFITLLLIFNIHNLNAQFHNRVELTVNDIGKTQQEAKSRANTVVLTVSGIGKTQQEAKLSAMRLAIEQAFGAFISSNTDMLNDKVVSDQITSIANGNIQSFEVLNEFQLPSGGWSMILKATVSLSKLSDFVKSRGVAIDFNGELFFLNIKQQILNEQSEVKSMFDLVSILHENLQNAFDYEIENKTPIIINGDNNNWKIPLKVSAIANKNIIFCNDFLIKTLNSISLKEAEVNTYKEMGKEVFTIYVGEQASPFYLRNKESLRVFNTIMEHSKFYPSLFKIESMNTNYSKDDIFKQCDGFNDYRKLYEFVQKTRPIDKTNKSIQLIILPKVNTIYATYTWSHTVNLEQIEKLNRYSVIPTGAVSFIKDGGFLIEDSLGNKFILALFDQNPVNLDSAKKVINNSKALKDITMFGYTNWRLPSIKELNTIDLKIHSKNYISAPIFNNLFETYDKLYLSAVDENADIEKLDKSHEKNILLFHFIDPTYSSIYNVTDLKKKLVINQFLRNNKGKHLCHTSDNCYSAHSTLSIVNKAINLRLVKNYHLDSR
jgi:hypothetical protein